MSQTDLIIATRGSMVTVHVEQNASVCPCRTPEGFRDPIWHKTNPLAPQCNAEAYIQSAIEYNLMALVMPASSRGSINYLTQLFGEIKTNDHVGVFPVLINGEVNVDYSQWDRSGSNYILYNGLKFFVAGWNLLPNPYNTKVMDHWELGLRLMNPLVPDGVNIF